MESNQESKGAVRQGSRAVVSATPRGSDVDGTLAGLLALVPQLYERLLALFERLQTPRRGRERVLGAFSNDPVRRVRSGRGNVVVRFVSRMMLCVVQAESRGVELAYVRSLEWLGSVIGYVCQPMRISVRIRDRKGRSRMVHITPDYLVAFKDALALVECKSAADLERDSQHPHPRYFYDEEEKRLRWPAAEQAVASLGFKFIVFSSDEVNTVHQRNLVFLDDLVAVERPSGVERVLAQVARFQTVRLDVLLLDPAIDNAALYWAIAHRVVWTDVEHELLARSDVAFVHDSESRMLAARHERSRARNALGVAEARRRADAALCPPVVLDPDASVLWDDVVWTVLHRTDSALTLQRDSDAHVVSLPLADVERLLRSGALRAAAGSADETLAARREYLMRTASEKELARARERARALAYFRAHGRPPSGRSLRSVQRYARWEAEGDRLYADGFFGLLRRWGRRPGGSDLCEDQRRALEEVVQQFAKDKTAGRVASAHRRLTALCAEREVVPAPSESTVRRALAACDKAAMTRERLGGPAAMQVSGPRPRGTGTPRHGDRPFEVAHLDHTPLDVTLRSGLDGTVLGTAQLTLLFDARTRMPLAHRLSFNAPSYCSVAGCLWDCVRRHARLPESIVTDHGAEFDSRAYEDALAMLRIHKVERPKGAPRFGSVIERLFGVSNTAFLHELEGARRHLTLGRGLAASHHPKNFAVWTLPTLDAVLSYWLYEEYPRRIHGTLGAKPGEIFAELLARAGERVARYRRCDEALRIVLAPLAQPPTRLVDSVRGVVVSYLRYWHREFGRGDVADHHAEIKVDCVDASRMYVRPPAIGEWLRAELVDGDADVGEYSPRLIALAIRELVQRRKQGRAAREINASAIGELLRSADRGPALERQAAIDAEHRALAAKQSGEQSGDPGLAKPPAPERDARDEAPEDPFEGYDGAADDFDVD